MDIGPGDYVECIDASWRGTGSRIDQQLLVPGKVYIVKRVIKSVGGLHLHGLPMHNPSGYDYRRFRPIYRPKADAFTHLLTDIPSDLETV